MFAFCRFIVVSNKHPDIWLVLNFMSVNFFVIYLNKKIKNSLKNKIIKHSEVYNLIAGMEG